MMQITHLVTGAAVGSLTLNSFLAFLAGIVMHFVVDKIPHYWPASKKGKALQVVIDHSTTYLIFALMLVFEIGTMAIWAGILGSLLVDIVLSIPIFFKSSLGKWHRDRQPHSVRYRALITDGALTSIGVLVLRFF